MWYPISEYGGTIIIIYLINIFHRLRIAVSKIYSTVETKEAVRIGHSGLLFQPDYSGEGGGAQKEICYVQYGSCFCFNSNVFNLYNNTIVARPYFNYNFKMCLLIYIWPSKCVFHYILEITKYTSLSFFFLLIHIGKYNRVT